MTEVVDRLIFSLEGDLSKLKAAYADAESGAGRAGQAIANNINNPMNQTLGIARQLAGAFGIAFSVQYLVSFGLDVMKTTAALDAQAKMMGVSTAALQSYKMAAIQSGAGAETGDIAIRMLTRNIGIAREAIGPARAAFVQLFGDSATAAKALAGGTESALPKVAAALLGIRDASERARLENVLLGRYGGQAAEAMLKLWADPAIIANMDKFAEHLSDPVIKRVEDLNKRFETLIVNIKNAAVEWALFAADAGSRSRMLQMTPQGIMTGQQFAGQQALAARGGALPMRGVPFASPGATPYAWPTSGAGAGFSTPNMDKFLADSKLAVDLAKQHGIALQIATEDIKAADAVLTDMGEKDKVHVSSLAQALAIIGPTNAKLIEQRELAKEMNKLEADKADLIAVSLAEHKKAFDEARLSSAIQIEDSLKVKAIAEAIRLVNNQGAIDHSKFKDEAFIQQLQDELDIAKVMPRYQQAELEMLRKKRDLTTDYTDAQKQEIRNIIDATQRQKEFTDAAEQVNQELANGLLAALQPGANLNSTFKSMVLNLAQVIEKLYIIEPLMKSLDSSNAGGGFLNMIGSLIGGAIGGGGGAGADVGAVAGGYAKGGAWSRGVRFASMGTVLNGPTAFRAASGTVIGGEAGPEALIPLARGPTGHLGVRSSGGGGGNVVNLTQVISISPDVSAISRAEIMKALPMIGTYAVQGVRQMSRRGA